MSLYLIQGAIEEGFIYGLVALGLLVSYRILNIADMTTDGSFVLGAAISSVLTVAGHPILGILLAFVGGGLAGIVTAGLQTKLGVPSIIAGIISMTALYTVNLLVQGGSSIFYPDKETFFTLIGRLVGEDYGVLVGIVLIIAAVITLMILFFRTQLGLSIRATGDNINMVESSSINPNFTITLGLLLSNGLVALSGALIAQKNAQSDINMGTGIVVIGLASLIIGGVLLRGNKVYKGAIGGIIGSIIYWIIITIALRYTVDQGYLKIVSAAIIAAVISYPKLKEIASGYKRRQRGKKNARIS